MNGEKTKLFIFQWLLAVLLDLVFGVAAVIGFCTDQIGAGIAVSLFGALNLVFCIFFIPHSVSFDWEKITLFYVIKSETIKYVNIKSCDREMSGVKDYPWGAYYRVYVDKPYARELKIPSTKEIDLNINKHINVQTKRRTKKEKINVFYTKEANFMRKKLISVFVVVVILLIGIIFVVEAVTPKTYETAKKECERFLKNNYDEMEEIAVALLDGGVKEYGYYKERSYIYDPRTDYVKFLIDGQGMLGGQGWYLYYTQDGTLFEETDEFLDVQGEGLNNIFRGERLDDHWWYFWEDWDATDKSYK